MILIKTYWRNILIGVSIFTSFCRGVLSFGGGFSVFYFFPTSFYDLSSWASWAKSHSVIVQDSIKKINKRLPLHLTRHGQTTRKGIGKLLSGSCSVSYVSNSSPPTHNCGLREVGRGKVIREKSSEIGMKEKERRRANRHMEAVKQFEPNPVPQDSSNHASFVKSPLNTFSLNLIYVPCLFHINPWLFLSLLPCSPSSISLSFHTPVNHSRWGGKFNQNILPTFTHGIEMTNVFI